MIAATSSASAPWKCRCTWRGPLIAWCRGGESGSVRCQGIGRGCDTRAGRLPLAQRHERDSGGERQAAKGGRRR
jgi:hypothetical protein